MCPLPCNPVLVGVGKVVAFDISGLLFPIYPEAYLVPDLVVEDFDAGDIQCVSASQCCNIAVIRTGIARHIVTVCMVEQRHQLFFLQKQMERVCGFFYINGALFFG